MTKEDIIKMAREAGCDVQEDYVAYCDIDDLVCFFHMAQATEREECAKVCEERQNSYEARGFPREFTASKACAAAIRARGQA